MQLPINIETLLQNRTIESDRIEYKRGWNPLSILHTLCAFANDFHNLGGGYIVVGIEEQNGMPVLPPVGVDPSEIDNIQKQILNLSNKIVPAYMPKMHTYKRGDKHIVVIWAPGGYDRPYKAPKAVSGEGAKEYRYYIRQNSSNVQASHLEERELMTMFRKVPFDDQVNHDATIEDLSLVLICEFLKKINSALLKEAHSIPFPQLCRQMNIIHGPDESIKPLNIGLLFFNQDPQKYFPQAQIDIVEFPDGTAGDLIREKIFKGPIHTMLTNALSYLKNHIVQELIFKTPGGQKRAERIFNIPFVALEEALVNAIYHRDYLINDPIEVRILPDEIAVISHPGLDRSIPLSGLHTGRFLSRYYRNRRIGDFLKELEVTEGRGTGIPKILSHMQANGSPPPIFECNEDRTYFIVRLPLHPKTIKQKSVKVVVNSDIASTYSFSNPNESIVLKILLNGPMQKKDIAAKLGREKNTGHLNRIIDSLLDNRLVDRTIPSKPRSRNQQYVLTKKGKKFIDSN